jgi:hypothetical protein
LARIVGVRHGDAQHRSDFDRNLNHLNNRIPKMNEQTRSSARTGGRAARRAARAAALPDHLRPVRPGMEGGTYKPLTQAQMERIHEAALQALETIGLADAPQSGIDYLVGAGCTLGDDGRIRFPRALVEDTIAKANRSVTLYSRNGKTDLELSGTKVHYGTAGAAVSMVDVDGRNYRDSTVQDLHDASRICEQLDNIHFVQRPMVCRDIADNLEMDLNTIYAACAGTFKHIGTSFTEPSHVAPAMEMIHMIAGGEDKWRERPFISKFELLCCATHEIRNRKLRSHGRGHQSRDAGPVAVCWHGRSNCAVDHRRSHHSSDRGMPGRSGLCKRSGAWRARRLWHMAFRSGPPHRGDVRGIGRTGAAERGMRSNA